MEQINIAKTYREVAVEWYEKKAALPENKGTLPPPQLLYSFADWLDKFQFVDARMQLLAMTASYQVDRAVLEKLVELVPRAKFEEIVRDVQKNAASKSVSA